MPANAPPPIETPSLLCYVTVRRYRIRQPCGRTARRYAISKHGHTFADQFRCTQHASALRDEGYTVTLCEKQKRRKKAA